MAAVSCVIPIYKVEPWLRQCLDSVLAQTLTDIEIIAVDDGSPDSCGAICDEYAARDGRVRVIHKENGGLVSAWKAGVLAATADYVGFVDGDDWVDPTFFADLYQGIISTGADVVCAEVIREQDPPLIRTYEHRTVYEGRQEVRDLLRSFFLNCLQPDASKWTIAYARWDKLYRRGLLLDNMRYFREGIALDEDRVANAALLADCSRVVILAHTGKYHYRIMAGSMSETYDEASAGKLSVFIDALLTIAADKRLDLEPIHILIGSAAYRRIYWAAAQPGASMRGKRAHIRELLAPVPAGALEKYARARGGLAIRLYCGMLQAGLVAPCAWAASLHAATSKANS